MSWLGDTNLFSEPIRPRPDPRVRMWFIQHEPSLWVSVLTLGELEKGVLALAAGRKRRALSEWLARTEQDFGDRTLPVDREVTRKWAELCAAERGRRNLAYIDGLLAATALVHDFTIVTRNVRDFPSEVRTFNPWA